MTAINPHPKMHNIVDSTGEFMNCETILALICCLWFLYCIFSQSSTELI